MPEESLERRHMTKELWIEILPWRNSPLVYIWNKTNRPISLKEHIAWFESRQTKLEEEPIFSYHDGSAFVGMARLDKLSIDSIEVSLIVNPKSRRNGYGRKILTDVCHFFSVMPLTGEELIAVIHADNLASRSLFESSHFITFDKKGVFDYLRYVKN